METCSKRGGQRGGCNEARVRSGWVCLAACVCASFVAARWCTGRGRLANGVCAFFAAVRRPLTVHGRGYTHRQSNQIAGFDSVTQSKQNMARVNHMLSAYSSVRIPMSLWCTHMKVVRSDYDCVSHFGLILCSRDRENVETICLAIFLFFFRGSSGKQNGAPQQDRGVKHLA